EDIERSGAASVPEALQMAPGVQVGRISSGSWAISLRGANSRFADKLQVLVDGRSVYTPLFSGTVWEDRELMLEDVERIEV
ncbi:Plug domain-containing protein, partial [Acinetobacter baumannii]